MSETEHLIGELRAHIEGVRSGAKHIQNQAVRNLVEQNTENLEQIVNQYDEQSAAAPVQPMQLSHHPAASHYGALLDGD